MGLTKMRVLRWLIELEDGPNAGALGWGMSVIDQAGRDLLVGNGAATWDELARHVAALRDDGAVRYTYDLHPAELDEPPPALFKNRNLQQCRDIHVTSEGRMAAREDRPTISITGSTVRNVAGGNITEVNLIGLFETWEAAIDQLEAPEAEKAEAKSHLRRAREALLDTGTGASGALIAQALARVAGL